MAPNPHFLAQVAAAVSGQDAALLVGCRSGARSTKALAALAAGGYRRLAHNSGGWNAWAAAGLPVEK
jgi:rhodanese-related sulfurtransferase